MRDTDRSHYDETQIADLAVVAATIYASNRSAIAARTPAGARQPRGHRRLRGR